NYNGMPYNFHPKATPEQWSWFQAELALLARVKLVGLALQQAQRRRLLRQDLAQRLTEVTLEEAQLVTTSQ
ncbi:hypothetical protein Q6272_30200, partial [Klebsiella pneumoniae]|uniref:hypothetical protein n=1 Tax=Klebsiella pneumoniae TaxID=573 RepID=UPI00273027CB